MTDEHRIHGTKGRRIDRRTRRLGQVTVLAGIIERRIETKRHPPRSTTVVGPPKTLMPIGCLFTSTVPTRVATQPARGMFPVTGAATPHGVSRRVSPRLSLVKPIANASPPQRLNRLHYGRGAARARLVGIDGSP